MIKTLSPSAFRAVTDLFHRTSGIRLGEAKHALVASRLQRLALEAGTDDVDAYVDRLVRGQTSAEEMVRLIDRLTTNETYFFREPQHFNDLVRRLQAHEGNQPFLVWSAASSTGEEAYSCAMVMAEVLGAAPWQVIGTDLSTSVVETARRGLYPLDRAQNLPQDYLRRYCLKGQGEHEGQLLVTRALRERVRFETGNLMATLPQLPKFDVIFLRNVLIYFDNDAKARIVRRVVQQLKPQGVLYTGHAESISVLGLPLKSVATAVHVQA